MFKKIKFFFVKKYKILAFILSLLCKCFFALFFITALSITIFMFFIRFEPKEIEIINNYINAEINKIENKKITYLSLKISSDSIIKINFIIKDLNINSEDFSIKMPVIIAKVNIIDFIFKKYILDNIEIFNLESNIQSNINAKKAEFYSLEKILQVINNIFMDLSNKISIKKISIKNNAFNFVENGINRNSFFIENGSFLLKKKNNVLNIKTNFENKINNNKFIAGGNCNYNLKYNDLKCELEINKISLYQVNGLIFKNFEEVIEYSENINGIFNLKIILDIEKSNILKNIKYTLKSDKANFNIKKLFNKKIFLENFIIDGDITNNGNKIEIKNFTTDFFIEGQKDLMNVKSNLTFNLEKNIIFNLKLNKAKVENLDILWPVFLEQENVKSWLVEHLKSGDANDIQLDMIFNYQKNVKNYFLDKLEAKVHLENVFLDYYDDLPKISNINADAIFTKKGMVINIIRAESEKSILTDGKIYLNFDESFLFIDFVSKGKLFELGYYINYQNKQEIKNIIENIIDAESISKIHVVVPLENYDKKNYNILNDFYIKINSNLFLKNNFIFAKNSKADLQIEKKKGNTIFNVDFDLKNSCVDFENLDFVKNKNNSMNIKTSVIIKNDLVEIVNLRTENTNLVYFNGYGVIQNGYLKSLDINNLKFKDTNGTIFLKMDENNISINIKTDILNIISGNGRTELKNLTSHSIEFLINSDKVILNKKYIFENFTSTMLYKNNDINYVIINTTNEKESKIKINFNSVSDKKEKYKNFTLEMNNFGNFLSKNKLDSKIGVNVKNGYLFVEGDIKDKIVDLRMKIFDDFEIYYNNEEENEIIKELKNNESTPGKIKKNIITKNVYKAKKLSIEAKVNNNNLTIKRFLLESREIFSGINISGLGNVNLKTGETDIDGLIIPLQKLNTLFGVNKVPLLNKILFGGKDGGLFTVGYKFIKQKDKDDYSFKITPISVNNINSMKNLMLLLLFL